MRTECKKKKTRIQIIINIKRKKTSHLRNTQITNLMNAHFTETVQYIHNKI